MKRIWHGNGLGRPLGVIIAIMVLISGVTFAALRSEDAVLAGSSITSATADLKIGSTANTYSASAQGFEFKDVEPGVAIESNGGNLLYLKNAGTTKLSIRLSLDPTTLVNTQFVNMERVYLAITPVAGGSTQEYTLAALLAGRSTGKPVSLGTTIGAGQEAVYRLQVRLAADVTDSATSGITLRGINMIFSGASVTS